MKKVIIAQDILEAVGGTQSLFSRGGISLFPARTSEEIVELHRRLHADLIVADLALPVMGGAALLVEVRGDAALKDVSIIMVHDAADAPALRRAAGANAILGKPVDAATLFARVSDLILVPQRKDMRVLLRISIEDGRGGGGPVFASSENISLSGMLIETNHPYRPGDLLLCVFHIGHTEVKAEGRVVRSVRAASGRYRCGVQFMNLDMKTMIVIEQFVQSRQGTQPKQS